MGIVFFAIVLLMLTIRFVKKGSASPDNDVMYDDEE